MIGRLSRKGFAKVTTNDGSGTAVLAQPPVRNKREPGTGGRWIHNGYVHLSIPLPNGEVRRISEHRLIMEQILGRELLPNESVHHRNGVRHDNRPANLELWVKTQPAGQRVVDVLEWAHAIIAQYQPVIEQLPEAA